ncbi:MAG TPA: acyltransferase [Catenuloplanes sp.]|jgi:peptidoglycan/LPS O-acetylase OafA/YrhL
MAWLDGLRAIAALLVVYEHLSHYLLRGARAGSGEWFHAGTAGVMLFFLVSGYIIPASLERHGSLRAFWVSRVCRLYPLYLVVAVLMVVLGAGGLVPLDPYLAAHPTTAALAHASMVPELLGVPLITGVFWTLSFEMAFYLLVSGLFAVRLHRASGLVAVLLAGVAVAAVPLTPTVLSDTPAAVRNVTIAVVVGLTVGVLAAASGRRWLVVPGGLLLSGLAGVLLVLNQGPAHVWDGLLILAVMFVGTAIYRADQGLTSWWQGGLVAAVVAAALLTTWFIELDSFGPPWEKYRPRAVLTLAVFAGLFALGMATRRYAVPRALAWLGLVSYSVYLMHYVLLQVSRPVLAAAGERLPALAEAPVVLAFLAALVGTCWLTYRFVEVPGQRLGRRWTRWMNARWGSDVPG